MDKGALCTIEYQSCSLSGNTFVTWGSVRGETGRKPKRERLRKGEDLHK